MLVSGSRLIIPRLREVEDGRAVLLFDYGPRTHVKALSPSVCHGLGWVAIQIQVPKGLFGFELIRPVDTRSSTNLAGHQQSTKVSDGQRSTLGDQKLFRALTDRANV